MKIFADRHRNGSRQLLEVMIQHIGISRTLTNCFFSMQSSNSVWTWVLIGISRTLTNCFFSMQSSNSVWTWVLLNDFIQFDIIIFRKKRWTIFLVYTNDNFFPPLCLDHLGIHFRRRKITTPSDKCIPWTLHQLTTESLHGRHFEYENLNSNMISDVIWI